MLKENKEIYESKKKFGWSFIGVGRIEVTGDLIRIVESPGNVRF
jgi:hypothetical protein